MEASRRNWLPSRSIKSKRIRYSPAVRMPNSEKTNRHSSAIRLMVNDSKSEGALSTLTMPSTDWSNKSTFLQPTHHWILVLARVGYWRKGAFAVYQACLHTQLWHRDESAGKERAQQSQSVSFVVIGKIISHSHIAASFGHKLANGWWVKRRHSSCKGGHKDQQRCFCLICFFCSLTILERRVVIAHCQATLGFLSHLQAKLGCLSWCDCSMSVAGIRGGSQCCCKFA
jgi:hypothetical protein